MWPRDKEVGQSQKDIPELDPENSKLLALKRSDGGNLSGGSCGQGGKLPLKEKGKTCASILFLFFDFFYFDKIHIMYNLPFYKVRCK